MKRSRSMDPLRPCLGNAWAQNGRNPAISSLGKKTAKRRRGLGGVPPSAGLLISYQPTLSRSNTQTIRKDGLEAVTKILSGFPHSWAYLKRSSSVANR